MQDLNFQLSGPQWPESQPPPPQEPKFLPGAVHSTAPHPILPVKLPNPEFGWKPKPLMEYLVGLAISWSSSEWTEHGSHTAHLLPLPQAPRVPAQSHPEGQAASSPFPWSHSWFTATSQCRSWRGQQLLFTTSLNVVLLRKRNWEVGTGAGRVRGRGLSI